MMIKLCRSNHFLAAMRQAAGSMALLEHLADISIAKSLIQSQACRRWPLVYRSRFDAK
jgi:hypothetical protein